MSRLESRRRGTTRRDVLRIAAGAAVTAAGVAVTGRPAYAASGAATAPAANAALPLRTGVDYSWEPHPRPSVLRSAGYTFACRYVSWDTTGKNLTPTEANQLIAAGVDIVTNWEYGIAEALNGFSQGVISAQEAHRQAVACGMPADRPIYFSVDFDASEAQQPAINAYFDGVASVIGRARVGAYGGYWVIRRLFDAGKITWGWQTTAWSGANWDPRAQLRQVRYHVIIDGAECDIDEAYASDFGQWGGASRQVYEASSANAWQNLPVSGASGHIGGSTVAALAVGTTKYLYTI